MMVSYKNYLLVYHRPRIGYFDPIFHYYNPRGFSHQNRDRNGDLRINHYYEILILQVKIFRQMASDQKDHPITSYRSYRIILFDCDIKDHL
jgi:hypothetical protein